MSYDVWMSIDTGGSEPACVTESINMTSNVSGMWRKAMGGDGLAALDGEIGSECIPRLRQGIAAMEDNIQAFRAMNPENGWGDADGAVRFLRDVLAMCLAHPKAYLSICR